MDKGIPTRAAAKRLNKIPLIILVTGLALIIMLCFYAVSQRQKKMQNAAAQAESIEAPPINNDTKAPQYLTEGYIKELEIQAQREELAKLASEAEELRKKERERTAALEGTEEKSQKVGLGYTQAAKDETLEKKLNKPFEPYYQEQQARMKPEKSEKELFLEKVRQQKRELALKAQMAPLSVKIPSVTTQGQKSAALPMGGLTGQQPQYHQPAMMMPQHEKPDQAQKRDFLNDAEEKKVSLANAYHEAKSPFELKQGHLIPMTLITKINSDLPGRIKAQVTENVYDTATGNYLLIPQGTMVNGIYDSRIAFGQKRVLIAWQRLVFPDGSTLNVGSMPGTDQEGSSGLADLVDNHYFQIFGSALLMSVVNAGFTLVTETDEKMTDKETAQDALAKSAAQQMQQTFARLIDKIMNIQPEIIIRQGKHGHIILTKDVIGLKPYNPSEKPTYFLKTARVD